MRLLKQDQYKPNRNPAFQTIYLNLDCLKYRNKKSLKGCASGPTASRIQACAAHPKKR